MDTLNMTKTAENPYLYAAHAYIVHIKKYPIPGIELMKIAIPVPIIRKYTVPNTLRARNKAKLKSNRIC